MDPKDSSHLQSPHYYAQITHHKEQRWPAYPRKETEPPVLLGAYMARIGGRGGLLSHEEEVELGRRVRSGDDGEARRRLVEGNIGLIEARNIEYPSAGGCTRVFTSVY
jgi:DNA-directed RNA polymerase sigma subunit (sigma70/sigma32)